MGLNPETLMSLKVTELRTELRKRGLPATGLKQVLVDRLKEDLLKETEPEPEEEEESAQYESADAEEEEEARTAEISIDTDALNEVAEPVEEPPVEKGRKSVSIEIHPPERVVDIEDDAPVEETKEEQERAVTEDAQATAEEIPTEEAPTAQEPLEEDAKPEPEEPTTVDAPATSESEAMDVVSYDDDDVTEEKPTEKEPEPVSVTEEKTRSASPQPPPAVPEQSLEVEIESELVELKPVESEPVESEPVESEPVESTLQEDHVEAAPVEAPTDAITATAEIADEGAPTAAPVIDTIVPPPEPISDDIAPETVVIEDAMEIDPAESLKRKRRSTSPVPPHLHGADAEQEVTPPSAKKQRADSPSRRGRDPRFRGLFNDTVPAAEELEPDYEDETPIEPSLHPATRALYIRNLVRPLQENAFRSHVLSLASRNDDDPADTLIETFYLDSIKSHALIVFENLTAANRVRVGIHNKTFPAEKSRKPLWADFVPEECVPGWVSREKARGGGRWEVIYNIGDEVTAELVEAGTGVQGGRLAGRMGSISAGAGVGAGAGAGLGAGVGAGAGRIRGSIDISNAPLGPRRGSDGSFDSILRLKRKTDFWEAPPVHARGPAERKPIIMNLDQLFRSTRAKPKLYYLPVDESVARTRLAKQGRDSRGRY
jgi:hypothetical protein